MARSNLWDIHRCATASKSLFQAGFVGRPGALQTEWHENGQKKEERTFKDGKEISAKFWNREGEEVTSFEDSKK